MQKLTKTHLSGCLGLALASLWPRLGFAVASLSLRPCVALASPLRRLGLALASLASPWPRPGHALASPWRRSGFAQASPWPRFGAALASPWPSSGFALAPPWPRPSIRFFQPPVLGFHVPTRLGPHGMVTRLSQSAGPKTIHTTPVLEVEPPRRQDRLHVHVLLLLHLTRGRFLMQSPR